MENAKELKNITGEEIAQALNELKGHSVEGWHSPICWKVQDLFKNGASVSVSASKSPYEHSKINVFFQGVVIATITAHKEKAKEYRRYYEPQYIYKCFDVKCYYEDLQSECKRIIKAKEEAERKAQADKERQEQESATIIDFIKTHFNCTDYEARQKAKRAYYRF